ncbi:MAG: EAL domain-containing protein [Alphaproteobacteria bacterium]
MAYFGHKNKIIIINDDAEILSLLKKELPKDAASVAVYNSLAKAKRSKSSKEHNIIFFNPYLESKSNSDFLGSLKKVFVNSIFVAVYNKAKEKDIAEWLDEGVVSFVAKEDIKKNVLTNLIYDLSLRFNISEKRSHNYDIFDGILACLRDAVMVVLPIKKQSQIVDFKIIISNLEAGKIFARNANEIEGEKLSKIINFEENKDFFEKLKNVSLNNDVLDLEFKTVIDNKEKWLYIKGLKTKTGIILAIADISLRRSFVKTLRETKDHSEEIDYVKNKILAEVAEEYISDVEEIASLSELIKNKVHGDNIDSYANYISEINLKSLDLSKSLGTVSEKIRIAKELNFEEGFMNHIPHMVCLCRCDKIENINSAGFKKLGFNSAGEVIGRSLTEFVDDDAEKKIKSGLDVLAFKNKSVFMTFKPKNAKKFETEVSVIRYHSEDSCELVMVSARDISYRKQIAQNIKRLEERLALILDKSSEAIVVTNAYGKIEVFNQSAINIFGYSIKEIYGQPLSALFKDGITVLSTVFSYGGNIAKEAICLKKNKETFWGEVIFSEVTTESSNHVITLIKDISKRKQDEAKLRFLATRDSLTGLVNREFFKESFKNRLDTVKDTKKKFAAILIDIDRFRNITDTLGQLIGEKVLIKASERLQKIVSKKDLIARFSGDEFVILVSNVKKLKKLIEDISYAMSRPFDIEGKEVFTSASMGILNCPDDALNFDQMMRNLEASLRVAKARGINSYQFYNIEMSINTERRALIENEIRRALGKGEFSIVYQPKVDIATGMVNGAEALLRWKNDKLGIVSPVEFIPVAEESGFIIAIGEWVFAEVCRQIGIWQNEGINFGRIAINLSGRQFMDLELIAKITKIIKDTGVKAEHMEIEITETTLAKNPEEAINILNTLKDMGIQIAIDDFGIGYSSLGYLKKFPIDCLKIDREFVKDLPNDEEDVAITLGIISLAQNLGMKLVAEGVETFEQLKFLKDYKCNEAQGYYLSYPIDAQSVAALLGQKIIKI